ncbi:MFS transporter [Arthrobacter sp. ISL-65]|nr:MFS transporter [Arthrobacter sp. ISL-65]
MKSSTSSWWLCVISMLKPALQTRLHDAAPGAASLASSLNHSALNVANALGAFLGGTMIEWG